MTPDYKAFLHQLATRMADSASVDYTSTPRDLWVMQMIEADSPLPSGPASVLRLYGGSVPFVPAPTVSIQCMTTAPTNADAVGLERSQLLLSTLLDAGGQPLRNLSLTGFRVLGFLNVGTPAQLGRDDQQRALWVFNFDARFVPTA